MCLLRVGFVISAVVVRTNAPVCRYIYIYIVPVLLAGACDAGPVEGGPAVPLYPRWGTRHPTHPSKHISKLLLYK